MENKEITLCALDILDAINDNNVEKVKLLVAQCNELTNKGISININELLPLFELTNLYNNEAYVYVVFNIKNVPDIQHLQNVIKIAQLRDAPAEEVESFIMGLLPQINSTPHYIIASLIHLSVRYERYDLLNLLRNKIATEE